MSRADEVGAECELNSVSGDHSFGGAGLIGDRFCWDGLFPTTFDGADDFGPWRPELWAAENDQSDTAK